MTDSKNEVLPRFELGSLDSESRVLTVTPQNQPCEPCTLILALFLHKKGQIGQICLVWAAMELSKFLQPGTHQHLLFSYKNHSRPIWDLNPWPSDVSEKFSAVKVWCSTDWANRATMISIMGESFVENKPLNSKYGLSDIVKHVPAWFWIREKLSGLNVYL